MDNRPDLMQPDHQHGATSPAATITAGPRRDRSISPQTAAAAGTNGIAIRYPMSVASAAGRSPSASLATMMPAASAVLRVDDREYLAVVDRLVPDLQPQPSLDQLAELAVLSRNCS